MPRCLELCNEISARLPRLAAAAFLLLPGLGSGAERLYIDYSPKPKLAKLTAPTLCIVDPYATVDLKTAHERGHLVLAYLSVVELAKGSPAHAIAVKKGLPFVGSNDAWDSRLMDILDPAWSKFMLDDCAAKAAGKGFDGFFLDTVDSLELIAGTNSTKLAACQTAIVQWVKALDQRWPKAKIIINRSFDLLPRLQSHVDGLLVESVYQGFDPATKRYRATDADGIQWLETHIRTAQAMKMPVYAVDYVNPVQRDLAQANAARLKALGCVPLVTTPDLTGKVLAP